jgi:hypothetical protein
MENCRDIRDQSALEANRSDSFVPCHPGQRRFERQDRAGMVVEGHIGIAWRLVPFGQASPKDGEAGRVTGRGSLY